MQDIPNLPSLSRFQFPVAFEMFSQNKKLICKMFLNGRMEFGEGVTPEGAANVFWEAIKGKFLKNEEVGLKRDLAFCKAFLESKNGVIFTNPQEKIELQVWLGEISRRYSL